MKFGITLPHYGLNATWDSIQRAAVQADRLGYASIWVTDHILIPKANVEPYGNIFEPVVTLALIAHLAPRATLGFSILVMPMRNPVLTAKQVASIDAATNGRVILGVGVGWNAREYANLGYNFHDRGKRLDEDIQLVRTVWSANEVTFDGKYTRIADGYSAPLPVRKTIPIWVGGSGEPSWRRAAKYGDGWQSTGASPEEMAEGAQRIREMGAARPMTLSVRLSIDFNPNVSPEFTYLGNKRHRLTGTPDYIRARLHEYAGVGLDHVVLTFPFDDLDAGLSQMEQFARDLMPEFP